MNILVTALNFSPEMVGCAKFTSEMVNWLAKKNNKVIVITTNPFYPEWKCKKNTYNKNHKKNILIIRCPIYVPKNLNGFTRVLHYISFFITSCPVILYYGIKDLDLAFTMCPTILSAPNIILLSLIKKIFFNTKFVSWIHFADLEIEAAFHLKLFKNRLLKKILLNFEKVILNNFDLISSISFYMNERIKLKISQSKPIFYLPDFIETKDFLKKYSSKRSNPYFKKLSLKNINTVIMYSGTLNEKLSCETLVNTIKLLEKRKDLIWLICGEGPKKDYFIQQIGKFENVQFHTFQPFKNLPDWLSIAEIHLIPQKISSVKFCLPSKLLGILACGKSVVGIAPKDTELGKVLNNYGIRISNEDHHEMADAILKLADDKSLRNELGEKGQKYIQEFHEKDYILSRILTRVHQIASTE